MKVEYIFVLLFIRSALAVLVGALARKKGYSYGWYLFFSVIADPIIAFITLRIADKRNNNRRP